MCDALGDPRGFHLTAGQKHDLTGAEALMGEMIKADKVIADTAYDAKERFRYPLSKKEVIAVVPSHPNRKIQPLTINTSINRGILLNTSTQNLSNTELSQHGMIKRP